ncbi:NHL domain-containing protein [Paenibacillus nasutitermitis]|uniref:Copper amine oxidase-like N-terminal domain-containing protein n=1 Tax=Paenibacillus nasutitermitis TaxID=1652958 RepID=A0A916YQI4_9BACL|nr:stalk domain-containing protein [Paenibacillus nasutitermitis]GGD55193.1 hypothetical protein GCM10010911_11080 [Paenibacillus nasutitermitis]
MKKMTKNTALLLTAAAVLGAFGHSSAAQAAQTGDSLIANKALYELRTEAGTGEYALRDGNLQSAAFRGPVSLLYDAKLKTYLAADTGNQRLRTISSGDTKTFAGLDIGLDDYQAPIGALADGSAQSAAFNHPAGLAADGKGQIYVADSDNHAIRIINKDGSVQTLAGSGELGSADGRNADARFYHPLDVAVTDEGIVYVADTLNHVIRKIQNGSVTTLNAASTRAVEYIPGAVEPAGDFADGALKDAKFNEPSGLALDHAGNLYVSDTGNQRIRYIDFAKGTVTTVAGGGSAEATYAASSPYAEGGYADGKALNARFHAPRGLTVTPDGGVLIADSLNHVIRLLKSGVVTTVAGSAQEAGSTNGVAYAAELNRPTDVVWIGGSSFAIADAGGNKIRIAAPYALPSGVKAGSDAQILYNNAVLPSDAPPVVVKDSTFVPMRVLTEKLGFKVQYTGSKAILSRDGVSYTVQEGSLNVMKTTEGQSPQTLKLTSGPFLRQDRLYLPVRFFAQEIGLDVQWLSDVRAVLIRDKQF